MNNQPKALAHVFTVTVTAKHQITLPASLARTLGWRRGDLIQWRALPDGRIEGSRPRTSGGRR